MNNNNNNVLAALIFAFFACSQINAISDTQVNVLSGIIGVGAGAAAFKEQEFYGNNKSLRQATFTTLGTGLAFWISKFLLSRYTPEGRYKRAMNVVNEALNDKLLTSAFSNHQALKSFLRTRHILHPAQGAYLAVGTAEMGTYLKNLNWAKDMLIYARGEKSASFQLRELCKAQEQVVDVLLHNCEVAIGLAEADAEEYHRHLQLYNAYLERQQREAMMEQKDRHHNENLGYKIGRDATKFAQREVNNVRKVTGFFELWKSFRK